MQKVILFLKGYIYIRVSGFAPERFVNLCGNRGIFLWGIRKHEESYCMFMKLQDFFKIAPLVRKTKTKVVLLKRIGLPFLMPEIYKRKMFMLGFMLTFWLWYLSSFFIWKIDLQGNVKITDEDILRTLSQQNVSIGKKVGTIDYEELEKFLRQQYPEIIWISAKQNGTIVEISVRENQTTTVSQKEETPCDLIASVDGILREMVVRQGVPLVSIGTEVFKGDKLVSGLIEIKNDDGSVRCVNLVRSDADIWIESEMPVSIEVPKVYIEREYTGRCKRNYSLIGPAGQTFETTFKASYLSYDEIVEVKKNKCFLLLDIPLVMRTKETREFQIVEYENDFNEGSQKLEEEFAYFLANLMEKGVQIISKNVRIEEGPMNYVLSGTVTVLSEAFTEHQIEEVYE